MKLLWSSFLVVALALHSGLALALDFKETYYLQMKLEKHGFNSGRTWGLMNTQTLVAIAGFARQYGIEPTADEVWAFMIRRSYETRTEINDETFLWEIKKELAGRERDPSDLKLRHVFEVTDGSKKLVCGEASERNADGEFVDYATFSGSIVQHSNGRSIVATGIDPSEDSIAFYTCATAFPKN